MIKAPPTPKGFRDILPELAKKRRNVINTIVAVLEENGFVAMETPTIEFADTLMGKYGEEERLIYQFTDRGGRKLALRYDLTVPLARFVATNLNLIGGGPFRRYQVGQVFRGENPQKGRWREFTQLDFDIVGSSQPQEDARVIATALAAVNALGIKDAVMFINDRTSFQDLPKEVIVALDKLEKIGKEAVVEELTNKGFPKDEMVTILDSIDTKQPTDTLNDIFAFLKKEGVNNESYKFAPTLARGLDYYTGSIFELQLPSSGKLSIGGGGRYDNLIGTFMSNKRYLPAGRQVPAVGFSFGLDRLIELLPS